MGKKSRTGGRPRGAVQRKAIALPSGDVLTPLYTTFSEETGLTPKSLLQTLSEPKKQVRR
jgi:hypothetical protein